MSSSHIVLFCTVGGSGGRAAPVPCRTARAGSVSRAAFGHAEFWEAFYPYMWD
jgi:hypothetical protein